MDAMGCIVGCYSIAVQQFCAISTKPKFLATCHILSQNETNCAMSTHSVTVTHTSSTRLRPYRRRKADAGGDRNGRECQRTAGLGGGEAGEACRRVKRKNRGEGRKRE